MGELLSQCDDCKNVMIGRDSKFYKLIRTTENGHNVEKAGVFCSICYNGRLGMYQANNRMIDLTELRLKFSEALRIALAEADKVM